MKENENEDTSVTPEDGTDWCALRGERMHSACHYYCGCRCSG